MHFDDWFEMFYWFAMAFICVVMGIAGWLIPWIGPTVILAVIGVAIVVGTYSKIDVLMGIIMFIISPLIGTLFHKSILGLGDYERLLGVWMTAVAIGAILAYLFQRNGKRQNVPPGTPAAHH